MPRPGQPRGRCRAGDARARLREPRGGGALAAPRWSLSRVVGGEKSDLRGFPEGRAPLAPLNTAGSIARAGRGLSSAVAMRTELCEGGWSHQVFSGGSFFFLIVSLLLF